MTESRSLKCLHLVGIKFSKEGYVTLGDGIAKAKSLKKLMINQSNIAQYGLQELANGFLQSSSVDYLDLQCNDLTDSHCSIIAKIITTQFEMRDNLKWKLGLRIPREIDVSKLGIRYIHLARNSIGNKGAISIALAAKQDTYIRGLNFNKNKIGESGMNELLSAVHFNMNLVILDVTENNPVYEKKHYDH